MAVSRFAIIVSLAVGLALVACTGPAGGAGNAVERDEQPAEPEVAAGDLFVDIYDAAKACNGTTFVPDLHVAAQPRIVEVGMDGEVVWEYLIPDDLKQFINPGLDVEPLDNGNILFVLPRNGVYEIDREGVVVWSHLDPQVSHDADRLANGNTLYGWGGGDQKTDAHLKEVSPEGELVWSWSAEDEYAETFGDVFREGWTHTNAVSRLANGNTLVSLRNFDMTVEVNPAGEVVWSYDWLTLDGHDPHEPEIQPNDRLLICLQQTGRPVVEIDRATGAVVWEYVNAELRTARDSDRLPNGNTLIQAVIIEGDQSVLLEVTPAGEIVWQLKLKDTPAESSPGFFFKAHRVCQE